MATYRLFSYRQVRPTPEEIADSENFYFPWESVSTTPTILTEPRTITQTEVFQRDGEDVEQTIEYTLEAGDIDPDWMEVANCRHLIELCLLRGEDDTEVHMELEYFDDVDEDGVPFGNQREVEKTVTTELYWRRYVLCCEHCVSYNLPDRFEARYEDVGILDDQTLRNIYELSFIDIEPLKIGDASQLNTLGLRNINWETTVPYVSPDVSRAPKEPAAPGPEGGTNTEGQAEE
tara:strand:+ start:662 stop:1360 length:699 start_codon:yes stop_codon:yes gene_type:complete